MEDSEVNNNRKAVITFIALAIVAIIVVGAVIASPKKASMSTVADTTTTTSKSSGSSSKTASSNQNYKDGTYSATGSYTSPGGLEKVGVTVTLASNKITSATVKSEAQDSEAGFYQSMFISGYKDQVVGRKISDVHLSRVSGSSLTSQGFDNAIEQIEKQAQA